MKVHTENAEYSPRLRLVLMMYAALKRNKYLPARRMQYDNWRDEITAARNQLKKIGQPADRIVITPDINYPEYCTILYKTPFEFEGTKDVFDAYLWENHATYATPSQYYCTGQHFTTGFKIGHIGGNLWKVAEHMGVDV